MAALDHLIRRHGCTGRPLDLAATDIADSQGTGSHHIARTEPPAGMFEHQAGRIEHRVGRIVLQAGRKVRQAVVFEVVIALDSSVAFAGTAFHLALLGRLPKSRDRPS